MATPNTINAIRVFHQSLLEITDAFEMSYVDGALQRGEIPMILAAITAQGYPLVQAVRGLTGPEFDAFICVIKSARFEV